MTYLSCLIWVCAVFVTGASSDEASHCPKGNECVPLSLCEPEYISHILFPCHSGLNLFCCPSRGVKNSSATTFLELDSRIQLFPEECGVAGLDDKITDNVGNTYVSFPATCTKQEALDLATNYASVMLPNYPELQLFLCETYIMEEIYFPRSWMIGGERAGLGQFPWMALLGYRQKHLDIIEYLCGGTIITEKYILTAAHCLAIARSHDLVHVRLGENDLSTYKDCRQKHGTTVCSDDPVNIPVQEYFGHQNYDSRTLKNDIALVKLKNSIKFTDFIQPICLPFGRNYENTDLTGKRFIVSGWGKTESRKLGGSPTLQFATVTVWNQKDCQKVVPPEVQPIDTSQLCANGRIEDACKGDSGGPLINPTVDIEGEVRNYQIGVVSFASTLTCGVAELPPIYTRIDKYLEWIVSNVK